jgi:hypothetical protein
MQFRGILATVLVVRLRQLALSWTLAGAMIVACTHVEEADLPAKVPIASGGFAGEPAGPRTETGEGGAAGVGVPSAAGGAPADLELALWPTYASDPEQPDDLQAVEAAIAALSSGSTTLPLAQRWDALSGSTGSPRLLAWTRLDAMTKPYRDRGGSLALCIAIVDRRDPAWPVTDELDSEAASSAMKRTIDEVFARYAGQLTHLCFGYEIDRYLVRVERSAQQRLLQFLKASIDYASAHPMRGSRTAIGAAITLDALAHPSDAPLDELFLGDEVVAVYDPLDPRAQLKAPSSIADELAAAFETLAARPGPSLPLSVFELGYPSSEAVGSSEDAQRDFYAELFRAVGARREGLGVLGLFGLADRAAADCEAEAALFGGGRAALSMRAGVRAAMGLRAEPTGPTQKLAWETVLSALSRYR